MTTDLGSGSSERKYIMSYRPAFAVMWKSRIGTWINRQVWDFRWKLMNLDNEKILQVLKSFGDIKTNILFVHSSLSHCGYVNGGPATVINVLREWAKNSTIVMPTHTYCYPDESGNAPVFDVRSTPSRAGAVTDYFWREPDTIRSIHPTHSVTCSGPRSQELCEGHESCDTPCGAGTPYERLVKQECSVLMFGTTMDTYTLFHTAEDAAQVPYLYEPEPYTLRVRDRHGNDRPVVMYRQNMRISRRFNQLRRWLEDRRLLVRRRLGCGELLFIPNARRLHERVVAELRRNHLFLVADETYKNVTLPTLCNKPRPYQ